MVARGAGAVGCAHCRLVGADRACQVCTRLVCARCAGDWATCEEPSGRVVRLGATARLRDVDPTGRLGLVTHWRRAPRLFDLRQLRWVRGVHIPRKVWTYNRHYPPRIAGDGRLYYGEWVLHGGDSNLFDGMRVVDLAHGRTEMIHLATPAHGTAISAAADVFYYVTDTQRVALVDAHGPWVVEPMPRKVLHAIHVDGERKLLAAGSWSEVVLHRFADGKLDRKLERIGHSSTAVNGHVKWLAIAGPWLVAAVVRVAGYAEIEVRRVDLDRADAIGDIEHSHAGLLHAASLSRDGRYLALGLDRGLLVHELGTDNVETFTEHTDEINLVRFAGEDHVLISADTDNRIVMRPRTKTGYARPLIPIDVPEAGVELIVPTPIPLAG